MSKSPDPMFACPDCGKQYRWKQELAGKKVRCKCSAAIRVPDAPSGGGPPESYELATDQPAKDDHTPAPAPGANGGSCPSCGAGVSQDAVICVSCGTNLRTGKALRTDVGKTVKSGGTRDRAYTGSVDGIFGRLSRSWEFAKISYGILWNFKQLVVFPILSGAAAVLVLASFAAPLLGTNLFDQLKTFLDEDTATQPDPIVYVLVFSFYFCSYFVIVFFNTALAACTMKVCAGEAPTIGYGLSIAVKRLPPILGWALVSATLGLILSAIENAGRKRNIIGAIVASILGAVWTVLTYFVVPVLAVEGVGPFKAVRKSVSTLKETWGEAVFGNFSLRMLSFILTLPVYLLLLALAYIGFTNDMKVLVGAAIGMFVLFALLAAAVSSAADMVFRSLLYNYATGRTMPEGVDEAQFAAAFAGSK